MFLFQPNINMIKKIAWSIAILSMFMFFFSLSKADNFIEKNNYIWLQKQFNINLFWISNKPNSNFEKLNNIDNCNYIKIMDDLFWIDNIIDGSIFFANINYLSDLGVRWHFSADEQHFQIINAKSINQKIESSKNFDEFYNKIRLSLIQNLIDFGYTGFDIKPYWNNWDGAIKVISGDFVVKQSIYTKDDLDFLIDSKLNVIKNNFDNLIKFNKYINIENIIISKDDIEKLNNVYLFKNEGDLRNLWYKLVSRSQRINEDRDYRRHNISAGFYNIGNVRLIMPWELFSLWSELRYRINTIESKKNFLEWYAIFGNVERLVYGGGLCGVATSFFQWTAANWWLELVQAKWHSIYYRNLYESEVNGKYIDTPGLEATLYMPSLDVKVRNIRQYPIISVFNYDWIDGETQEVFTIAKNDDVATFYFVWKSIRGGLQCYTWNIKWKNITNCYKQVKNW